MPHDSLAGGWEQDLELSYGRSMRDVADSAKKCGWKAKEQCRPNWTAREHQFVLPDISFLGCSDTSCRIVTHQPCPELEDTNTPTKNRKGRGSVGVENEDPR